MYSSSEYGTFIVIVQNWCLVGFKPVIFWQRVIL